MKPQLNILNQFPKASFWDVEISQLDVNDDRGFIIPRALYLSTAQTLEADINKLEQLYKPSQIIETLKTTKELISNNVCALVAKHYHIPSFSRFAR